jgi:hypothetical protein
VKRVYIFAIASVAFAYLPVSATIINIPGDYSTIQGGIGASSDGDTLVIEPARLEGRNIIRMRIPLKPEEVTVWYLDYTQRIESDYARYILTSTSAWGQPFEEATYRFIIPVNYRIIETWPRADKARRVKPNLEIWCEKINFMPDQDMRIFWDRE